MGLSCFGSVLEEIYYFKPQVIYVSLSESCFPSRQLATKTNAEYHSVLDCRLLCQLIHSRIFMFGLSNKSTGSRRSHVAAHSSMGSHWPIPQSWSFQHEGARSNCHYGFICFCQRNQHVGDRCPKAILWRISKSGRSYLHHYGYTAYVLTGLHRSYGYTFTELM